MQPANKRMRERSRQPIPPPLSPSISLSGAHHFLFFHLHLSVMRLLIPPALVLAHVYLRRSHFFFSFFSQSLIHSIFSPLLSSRLSGPPLLFYSRGCNGSNVKAESPAVLPPLCQFHHQGLWSVCYWSWWLRLCSPALSPARALVMVSANC